MAGEKSKDKNQSRKLQKEIRSAKKMLKELKKEKQAAETLINYCNSMGKYFADQAVLEELMDVAVDSQNEVDKEAAGIIPCLAAEASNATCETTDEFLKGFHESEEYAEALVAYRDRVKAMENLGTGSLDE